MYKYLIILMFTLSQGLSLFAQANGKKVKKIEKNNVEAMNKLVPGTYKYYTFDEKKNEFSCPDNTTASISFDRDSEGVIKNIRIDNSRIYMRANATKNLNYYGARTRHYFNTHFHFGDYTEHKGIDDRTIAVYVNDGILFYRYDKQRSLVYVDPYYYVGNHPPVDIDVLESTLKNYRSVILEAKKEAEQELEKTFESKIHIYDNVVSGLQNTNYKIARNNETKKYGILDKSKNTVIDYQHDYISFDGANFIIQDGKYYGITNLDMKTIAAVKCSEVEKFQEYYILKINESYGLLHESGELILKVKYNEITQPIINNVVWLEHKNKNNELFDLSTRKRSGEFRKIDKKLKGGKMDVEKDGQFGKIDPLTFETTIKESVGDEITAELLAAKKADPNVIEMSWSVCVSTENKRRHYFGVIWNKRTGKHRMLNPRNIFDHSYKSLPKSCHLTDEQIKPFLHEYGDIMFDVDASPDERDRYQMMVWNTYTGKVGLFSFDWNSRSFKLYKDWYIHRLSGRLKTNSVDDIMVDFEMDHGQSKLKYQFNYVAWNKKSVKGRGVGYSTKYIFPNYNPEIDGEILIDFDIGKNTTTSFDAYLYTALVYTTKTLKHRYMVYTSDYSSPNNFTSFGSSGFSKLHLPHKAGSPIIDFTHEHLVLQNQTYQECDASGVAPPTLYLIDLETKEFRGGYISFVKDGRTVKGDINLGRTQLEQFHKGLFKDNDGEMGAELVYDEPLEEEVLIIWNKKTGYFSICSEPYSEFNRNNDKNLLTIKHNILENEYNTPVDASKKSFQGTKFNLYSLIPSLPEDFCEQRKKGSYTASTNNRYSNNSNTSNNSRNNNNSSSSSSSSSSSASSASNTNSGPQYKGSVTIKNDTGKKLYVWFKSGGGWVNNGSTKSAGCYSGQKVYVGTSNSSSSKKQLFEITPEMCGKTIKLSKYM